MNFTASKNDVGGVGKACLDFLVFVTEVVDVVAVVVGVVVVADVVVVGGDVVVVVADVVVVVVDVVDDDDGREEGFAGSRVALLAFLAFRSAFSRFRMPSNLSLSLSLISMLGRSGIKCSNSSSPVGGIGASQAGHFPGPICLIAFSDTIH